LLGYDQVSINNFSGLFASVKMDSRLRGNNGLLSPNLSVIPAQAGIHGDKFFYVDTTTSKKS
jgi:hypothetical protein